MSGIPSPFTKLTLSERLRGRFKSKTRGQSPSAAAFSTQTVTSSTAQSPGSSSTQIPVLSSPPPPASLSTANSTNAGADPSSPQATSHPSFSYNLLDNALRRLSDRDRAILLEYIPPNSTNVDLALKRALDAAQEKRQCCIEKRWKFQFAGRTVTLRDEADKVIRWLDRFKDVGDIAVSADPLHAGLIWAGMRTLLEAAVSEANQMASLLVGCEIVLYMVNRLKAYMDFLHGLPVTLTRTNFETAVTELYAHILQFLARAIQIYQTSTVRRALRGFWEGNDVLDFEKASNELGTRVEIEASNCDRTLDAQDREQSRTLKKDLQRVLEDLKKSHLLQESLNRIEIKLDVDKLPYAKGAMFNSYGDDQIRCHPATRVDLLHQIQDWAQKPDSKSIFWLSGMAGTGKSTISRTVAEWLSDQGGLGGVDLGASFFFKRGERDRGSASLFFPTITRELVLKIPGLETLVADVVRLDPFIFDKSLGEQFNNLICQPLQKLKTTNSNYSTLVVVVDALDECEEEDGIKTILDLWSRLPQISIICLRLFLTSRPDLPIQLGFKSMSIDVHQDVVLHDDVPQMQIRGDISIYLQSTFAKIRERYNLDPPLGVPLNHDWPGEEALQALVERALPLFIVAATICRFVDDSNWNPKERLEKILHFPGIGELKQIERTYLPVLTQLLNSPDQEEKLYEEFRMIAGSIVTLAEPLSVMSLGALLNMPQETIVIRLRPLKSVLRVPADLETPVRTFHLSFSEFLLSKKLQDQPFGVNGPAIHQMLFARCLELLSDSDGLRENICGLQYPGQPRQEVSLTVINKCFLPAFQYACRYWVHHVQQSQVQIHDDDEVHVFLQKHFLHWLEALSLMNRIAEVVGHIGVLQSLLLETSSTQLSLFLEDARRIILSNRYIVDLAPFEIYFSAMVFAPQSSMVRNICGQVPSRLQKYPIVPATWSPELQKLEGHTNGVNGVAFSRDGSQLASASSDQTVRLWNPTTGQEVQKLEGHTAGVSAVAFSRDGSQLASASWDRTVRLWNLATGQEVQRLKGHTDGVNAVAFSRDGSQLASASDDQTVRLWNLATGQEVQKYEGYMGAVNAVAFSRDGLQLASASDDWLVHLHNLAIGQKERGFRGHAKMVNAVAFSRDGSRLASASDDQTVILWNSATGQEILKLEGHTDWVRAVVFSRDSSQLASAAWDRDRTVRLWNPATGQEVKKLEGHTDGVNAVAFSRDGSQLASASNDRTVRLWNPAIGQETQKFEGHTGAVNAVVFSRDGSQLASISDEPTVKLWNPATGQEVQKLEGHTRRVSAVAFSRDGSQLASGSWDETVRLWNLATGQEVQRLKGHYHAVTALAFSRDGSQLASGSTDQTVVLWNPATGQKVREFSVYYKVDVVIFSRDGSQLASASGNGTAGLWNLATGQEVHMIQERHNGVNAVAFSRDGSQLASGSWDRKVRLWNSATGQEVQRLEGHTERVRAVAFSRDGSQLASASDDRTVRLWNLATGQEVQKLEGLPLFKSINFSVDNQTLLTDRGALHIDNGNTPGEVRKSLTNKAILIHDDWIQQGNRNILWLPQEYRGSCYAAHGDVVAIGQHSGRVSIIQLNDT